MKRKLKIRVIDVIISFVVLIIIIMAMIIFRINNSENKNDDQEVVYDVSMEIEKLAEKNWDSNIVETVTVEDVPIPRKYQYKSGDKSTGIILYDEITEAQLWIPYQEKVEVNVDEYLKNVKSIRENIDDIESIKKYGGFFIGLNQGLKLEDMKTISNDDYNAYMSNCDIINKNEEDNSINKHVVNKTEIALILQYFKDNDIQIGNREIGYIAYTIEAYSTLDEEQIEEEAAKISKEQEKILGRVASVNNDGLKLAENSDEYIDSSNKSYATLIDTSSLKKYNKYMDKIPVPKGYQYQITSDGGLKIRNIQNKNLVFIWVPLQAEDVKDIENQKNKLKVLYKEKTNYDEDSQIYKLIDEATEEYDKDFVESIKSYGGFYVSEAELSYTSDKVISTRARGLNDSGEFYKAKNGKIEENIKKENSKNNAINLHVMYGAEYDAMILWIANTNKDYELNVNNKKYDIFNCLLTDSTYVGYYKNSNIKDDATANEC